MRTVAKKIDGGYLINGAKMWISNSPIADVFHRLGQVLRRMAAAFAVSCWSAA